LRKFNQTVQLAKLQEVADAIVASDQLGSDATTEQVQELLLVGTSMGGARPKAVVEDNAGLWIAKFNRQDDRWNNARVEHAMLNLGRACGLTTAESRLFTVGDRDVLLVKRFDRERADAGYLRARMVSGLTLLRADDGQTERDRWSYVLLVEELRRASAAPDLDAGELFRRMCFNALISNADDHPRNHAVISKNQDWRLSPAYDLTPTASVSRGQRRAAFAPHPSTDVVEPSPRRACGHDDLLFSTRLACGLAAPEYPVRSGGSREPPAPSRVRRAKPHDKSLWIRAR
jgi:serine/threonine-protein kinase HipA